MKGFTLVELLVVVLIIGILAAVAVPQYQMAVYKARFNNVRSWVHSIRKAQEVYYMANGRYAEDLNDLDVGFPPGCQYIFTPSYSYDTLDCPDARVNISRTYHSLTATVKNCPKYKGGCVSYVESYDHSYASSPTINKVSGRGPNCIENQAGGVPKAALQYAEKVCLSLGGVKTTEYGYTRYYL